MIILPIPEFEGYFAGEDGHIYSNCPRGRQKGAQPLRKLRPNIQTNSRYFIVNIRKNGDKKFKSQRVHRLVCITFNGFPSDAKITVSHLDGNWKNNVPDNLAWESYCKNLSRKKDHGTDDVGFKNSRALINSHQLQQIRDLLKLGNLTHKEIGAKFNVGRVFITKIANNYRYKGQ